MLVLATNLVIKQTMAGRHRTLTIVSAGQRFECTRVSNTLPIPWELAVSYATLSNWTCNAPFGGAKPKFHEQAVSVSHLFPPLPCSSGVRFRVQSV